MYTVVKKILDGIEIIGYVISDEDGIEKSLKEGDIIKLCHKGMLTNASTVNLDDKEILTIHDKLDKLPSTSKAKTDMGLRVICRLVRKTQIEDKSSEDSIDIKEECIGYIVQDRAGKKIRIDRAKAWKLAKHNNLIDIKATIVNGKKIIQSEKQGLLENLPTMEA